MLTDEWTISNNTHFQKTRIVDKEDNKEWHVDSRTSSLSDTTFYLYTNKAVSQTIISNSILSHGHSKLNNHVTESDHCLK